MAIFMIDYINGNNNRGGDSWAVTLTASDGVAHNSTNFTSDTGGFTGKEGRYIYIAASTPFWGTIVTVNSDTSVELSGVLSGTEDNLTYTVGGAWADLTNGATAARLSSSDEVRIAKSSDPTSTGQNATWTNLSKTVTLTSAVTTNIDLCENAFTDDTGGQVTCTADGSDWKEGTYSAKFVIAAGAGTGLLAHHTISEIDISTKQQVSFWIKSSVTLAASDLSIHLCSDDAGTTVVNTINIPAIIVLNKWHPITIDTTAALGSSIKAVSLYMNVDKEGTIYLDNILACKASSSGDSITLQSLISKNTAATGGDEAWYAIQSINGTTILLDNSPRTLANAGKGYSGTTESVTLYKRETIKSTPTTDVEGVSVNTINESNVTYKGGYNTSSGSQDGETFFDGLNGRGTGLYALNISDITIERLSFYRYFYGFYLNSTSTSYSKNNNINIFCCNSNEQYGIMLWQNSFSNAFNCDFVNNNYEASARGIINYAQASNALIVGSRNNIIKFKQINNQYNGFVLTSNNRFYGGVCKNNTNAVLANFCSTVLGGVYNTEFEDNSLATIIGGYNGSFGNGQNIPYFKNCIFSDSSLIWWDADYISAATTYMFIYVDARIYAFDNSSTDYQRHFLGGTFKSETSIRHTASGLAWKITPNEYPSSWYPLSNKIATILCTANKEVTVKLWARRSNTGMTLTMRVPKYQIAGVDADVTDSVTAAVDTWEELSLSFTPTEDGNVDIFIEAYGEDYIGYIDDMTVTTVDNPTYTLSGLDYALKGLPIYVNSTTTGSASGTIGTAYIG